MEGCLLVASTALAVLASVLSTLSPCFMSGRHFTTGALNFPSAAIMSRGTPRNARRKKKIRVVVLGIVLAGSVIGLVFLLYSYPPMDEARQALQSDATVTVEQGNQVVFSPVTANVTTGLVLYPGGKVNHVAYAPLAKAIAAHGYLVVIVPMPLDLAVLAPGRAASVIASHADIETWAVGGHSLGGAMAASFVHDNPGSAAGLVLLAAYPANWQSLADAPIQAISIWGTRDGVVRRDINATRSLLPPGSTFLPIEGGNHAYFGYYGEQLGDNAASITRQQQHEITTAAITGFLAGL